MTRHVSYPSDEVARHGAVEMARHGECGLIVCVTEDEDGNRAVRFSRFGHPAEDQEGDALRMASLLVDDLLRTLAGDL